jgi:hypothetical protein
MVTCCELNYYFLDSLHTAAYCRRTELFGSGAFCTSKQTSSCDLLQHISCGTMTAQLAAVSSRFSVSTYGACMQLIGCHHPVHSWFQDSLTSDAIFCFLGSCVVGLCFCLCDSGQFSYFQGIISM